jgi:DNA-binding NtrC family response regulator
MALVIGKLAAEELHALSPAMREVTAQIVRAATTRAGVLVSGEDGTGRCFVARAIHAQEQSGGAFVIVDCGQDPDKLEAELFGSCAKPDHEERRGLERIQQGGALNAAHRGTLYLRNVSEAPARVQARLARVLRDREAMILETERTARIDVRPMAGVESGVENSVRDGRVREDLFRRLSTLRIDLPALRNRREDLPAIVTSFVQAICASHAVPVKAISPSALSLMTALPWRGNVAELRALLENVVCELNGDGQIGVEDLLRYLKLDSGTVVLPEGATLRQARARFEREYIAATLAHHRGRISDAAKALGIQRTNLYRKIRTLRVDRHRKTSAL